MKRTYPEELGQIGDFYKGGLEEGNIEPSAGLWNSIESSLNAAPTPTPQQAPAQVTVPGTNFLTFNAIWKGAVIIGAVGTITVLVNNKFKETQNVPNNNQSIENKNIILSDTIAEVKTEEVITAKKEERSLIERVEDSKNDELISEPLPEVENEESIAQDTTSVKQPVLVVEEKTEKPKVQEEEKPKVVEKEAVKKPSNIFERKAKQQKDTSSHLFQPKK